MVFSACIVVIALSASAQITVGPNLPPGTTSYAYSVAQDPYSPAETAWTFGTSLAPISISYNPSAGVWQKQLFGAGQLDTFQEVNMLEYIQVGTGSTFTDWHQSITTPNFVWSNDADDSFFTINGGAQQFTGVSYSPDFTGLNITFPAGEPAGTVIMLHGELEYIGGPTFDNNANALVVNQYATIPEPSALALLGLGALGVLVSRRRK